VIKQLHTHTKYCDGLNSAEEMVEAAIECGCDLIGFSGHENTPFDESWCMTKESTAEYLVEVSRLKREYAGKIQVKLGIERDYYSTVTCDDEGEPFPFDYVIGSVHYIRVGNEDESGVEYIPVDENRELLEAAVAKHFDGDVYKLTDAYFALVADVVEKTDADIIGHFDLITKFNEDGGLFDESDARYVQSALEAVRKLVPYGKPFEVNVGAILRGYRSTPYPAKFILEEIHRLGGKIIVTGDCHDVESVKACVTGVPGKLDLDEVRKLLEECGFEV